MADESTTSDTETAGAHADPLDADYRQNIQDIRASMAESGKIAQERSAALAGPRGELIQMARRSQPQPPVAKELPATPQRNSPGDDENWLMMASVLGAIGGGLTRRHVTNSLAAMTGALEGYTQGSQTKFEQNMKLWNAEADKIRESNTAANDRYKEILASNKLAFEEKLQEIQMTAAHFDDRAAMQLAQTQQLDVLGRLIEQRSAHQERMTQAGERMRMDYLKLDQQARLAADRNATTLAAAKERAGGGAQRSEEAIDDAVSRALNGDPNATKGWSVRSQDYVRFSNRLAERMRADNIPVTEIARMQQLYAADLAGGRSVGIRLKNLEQVEGSLASLIPQAYNASEAVKRFDIVTLNKIRQAVSRETSDPKLRYFLDINWQLAEQVARSQKPTGILDVALQQSAFQRLNTEVGKDAYKADLQAFVTGVKRETEAAQRLREGKPVEIPSIPGAYQPPDVLKPPAASGSTLDRIKSKLPEGWSVEPVQ